MCHLNEECVAAEENCKINLWVRPKYPKCYLEYAASPQTEQAEALSSTDLLCCPFCGVNPETGPENPEKVGDAFGFVRCMNEDCPAQPTVDDGEEIADERGTAKYIQAAVKRWNKRAI